MLLSIVTPAYNEAENLCLLHKRLCGLDWNGLGLDWEWMVVDDHSRDATPQVMRELLSRDPRVRWLRLSRNFGSHAACTAGLEQAQGEAAVVMAADLQDPPEAIAALVAQWRSGAEVVWAVRGAREGESLRTRASARLFYALMRRASSLDMPPRGVDFFLLSRAVIEALRCAPERNASLIGQVQWLGFDQASIVYTKQARAAGRSKWTFAKKLKLSVDWLVGFSYFPIRFMSGLGVVFALVGFLYALFLAVRRIVFVVPVEGWTSMICVVLITSGVQLVMLGVLGEYLWRTFDASRQRPRYVIQRREGFPKG